MFCPKNPTSTISQARDEIASGPPPRKGGRWVVRPDIDDARRVIGRAFAGGGGRGSDENEGEGEEDAPRTPACTPPTPGNPFLEWGQSHITYPNREASVGTATYLVSGPLLEDYYNGALILCSTAAPTDVAGGGGGRQDESIVAVASVLEHNPAEADDDDEDVAGGGFFRTLQKKWVDWMVRRHLANEVPELFTSPALKADLDQFTAKLVGGVVAHLPRWHREHGPKMTHWWIHDVGVDPAYQGRGYGKELVGRIGEAADDVGMACYLYCAGEKNRRFYEGVGFAVASHKVVEDPTTVEGGRPLDIFLMIRDPR